MTASYWMGSDGSYYVNTSAEIFEDLGRQKFALQLFRALTPNDEECQHLHMQTVVDICKMAKGIVGNPFLGAFVNTWMEKLPSL